MGPYCDYFVCSMGFLPLEDFFGVLEESFPGGIMSGNSPIIGAQSFKTRQLLVPINTFVIHYYY
jgi:hypothetical protein